MVYQPAQTGPVAVGYTAEAKPDWVWETGLSYSAWKDRLMVSYTLEERNFPMVVFSPAGASGSYTAEIPFPECHSTLQELEIRVKALDGVGVRWLTGLTLALLRNKTPGESSNSLIEEGKQDVGDDLPGAPSWTGGWVNRIAVGHLSAGLDLLYHFGETEQTEILSGSFDNIRVNSIMTPNIYLGYQWHLPRTQTLECFVETRGLFRNSTNDLLDDRRYYTVGGKLCL